MTSFEHIQNGWIHFLDQMTGTGGVDVLTLDTTDESSDPTGSTSIDAKGGNDSIAIGQYLGIWDPVTVLGGDGNDIVNFYGGITSSHDATVDGGAGNDSINLNSSILYPDGLTFVFSPSFSIGGVSAINMESVGLSAGDGDDDLTGGNGNDGFYGGGGLDILRGSGGSDGLDGGDDNDKLYGGQGGDFLNGGAGDDEIYGGFGINTIDGGSGIDTVDYSAVGEHFGLHVQVSLTNGIADLSPDNHDTLSGVENVVGTSFNDTLAGDLAPNTFYGLGGDDLLLGSPGDPGDPSDFGDFLYGGLGKDTLYGKYGDDTLDGAERDDTIYGGGGDDTISGGDGDDDVHPGLGADTADGGDGQDTLDYSANATAQIKIDLGTGQFWLKDGNGDYQLTGETDLNFEVVLGGDANEEFIAGADLSGLNGFGGDDTLRTTFSSCDLAGHAGDDTIYALGDINFAYGGEDSDTIYGGAERGDYFGDGGDDTIYGGAGDQDMAGGGTLGQVDSSDVLYGRGGEDIIMGGDPLAGSDRQKLREVNPYIPDAVIIEYNQNQSDTSANTMYGGANRDWIFGAKGVDTIDPGDGNDLVYGGFGKDRIVDSDDDPDFIEGGRGNDTIIVTALAENDRYLGDGEAIGIVGEYDIIDFSSFSADITLSDSHVTIGGTHGTAYSFEELRFGSGDDTITGGDTDEVLKGNGGDDSLNGGAADDTLDGGGGNDTASYEGASAGVTVTLGSALPQNTGGGGTDSLISIENLTGSSKADTLTGNGSANTLSGLNGNDSLKGGAGGDKLTGGDGSDTLDGGSGGDSFVYDDASESTSTHYDTVKNPDLNADKWDVAGSISGIDAAITHGALRSAQFDGDLAAAADSTHLKSHHAVLFTADSGNLAGKTFLLIDQNGTAGYQSGGDLVVLLTGAVGSLNTSDFI